MTWTSTMSSTGKEYQSQKRNSQSSCRRRRDRNTPSPKHLQTITRNISPQTTPSKPMAIPGQPSNTEEHESSSPCKSPAVPLLFSGAKFIDPPPATVLPKPPSHWVGIGSSFVQSGSVSHFSDLSNQLKIMLNVQG